MRAVYASDPAKSRGRLVDEGLSTFRSPFQRDRDRIIHSSAFRRLKHKTQVFVEHEGDYFRTRLTHSLEVAQVARTMARALGLDEDLTEAVALAHDLGHPPFGHTGEDALSAAMAPYGGFDHNAQAIRIVTHLERHYADFDGLNLTWETLEGIAKHNGPVAPVPGDGPVAPVPGGGPVAPVPGGGPVADPIPWALAEYCAHHDLELHTHASAEAQVAALADDVAYNHHDLHDGLRAELFSTDELAGLPILDACFAEVDARYPGLNYYRRRHEALRRFFGVLVEDVLAQSTARLAELDPRNVADIRGAGRPVVRFSDALFADLKAIREFLFHRMYRAPSVVEMRAEVTRVVAELFPFFMAHPGELPKQWRKDVEDIAGDETALARIVSDYIAGMTDRFALQTHARVFGSELPGVGGMENL
ncbi:deoxyguanosinetriphosphate triphosphohydrolase [Roseicyclus sp.]|uniref:deoxyguanosinetriphosphate triphosphohydrolase n=1 Tax=Roseicyclus sp. TaxID=1914329 RepID=UPI003FA038AC